MPIRISAKHIGLDILQPIAIVRSVTLSGVREAKHQAYSNQARRITYPLQPCPISQPRHSSKVWFPLVKLPSIMPSKLKRAARREHYQPGSRRQGRVCIHILIYIERQEFTCIQPTSSRQQLCRRVKLRCDEGLFNHEYFLVFASSRRG